MTETSPTRGWKFNQIGIRVANLERSVHFYETVLGMKQLARMAMDSLVFVLLGYPEGEAEGGAEGGGANIMARQGVLELVWSEHSQKPVTNASHHPEFGLVKLCFTVPDLEACMARLKSFDVTVLKSPGTESGEELVARAVGAEDPAKGHNKALWDLVRRVGFVEDPDGYLIELVEY